MASVTLLCLTPALAAIVARLISREGLPWFPSSCGDCFRGRYAQSTPTAARVRWPFVVALWSASLLLPTLLTAAGAATYFGALPDHFSSDPRATLPKEIRELSPGGVAVSMLLLLGVLMPLPFLPLFLLIESGLRGYFVTRLRLALPPRASVCIGALFPAVVALPIFGMGHLYGTTHPGAPAPAIFVALWYMMAVGIVSGALALCQGSAVPSSFLVGSATCLTLVPVLFAGGDALMIVGPTPAGALGSLYWALTAAIVLWRRPAWERKWHPLRAPNRVMGAARDASQADDETKAADDRAARKAAKEAKKAAKKEGKKKGKHERTTDDHVHIDIGQVGGRAAAADPARAAGRRHAHVDRPVRATDVRAAAAAAHGCHHGDVVDRAAQVLVGRRRGGGDRGGGGGEGGLVPQSVARGVALVDGEARLASVGPRRGSGAADGADAVVAAPHADDVEGPNVVARGQQHLARAELEAAVD